MHLVLFKLFLPKFIMTYFLRIKYSTRFLMLFFINLGKFWIFRSVQTSLWEEVLYKDKLSF